MTEQSATYPFTPAPYVYVDAQNHRLTIRPAIDSKSTPYVWLSAESLALGGDVTNVWLNERQQRDLDALLDARDVTAGFTDHTGDMLTVQVADVWTTFTVSRDADADDDAATVPVVVLTGRLPEVRAAVKAAAVQASERAFRNEAAAAPEQPAPAPEQCTAPAYAFVIVQPDPADADALDLTAGSHHMPPAAVAYGLRNAADEFDRRAREEGDEPMPYGAAPYLTSAERRFLTFALNRAADTMRTEGGFTDADEDALSRLRDLAEHITSDTDPDHPADEEQPRPHPAVGARYVKRAEPDAGRIVTVNKVWAALDGHTAVAYEWDDPRASYSGSACPLTVFERTYAPEAEQRAAVEEQPTAPGWTLTPDTLDTFLRALVNELDYDLHKSWECNEETGEDDYPTLVAEAGKMLDAITGQEQRAAAAPEQPTGVTWEVRASHASRLYATAAIQRDDARAEVERLRTMYNASEARVSDLIDERDELKQRDAKLSALEAAGVDNWDGYSNALATLRTEATG